MHFRSHPGAGWGTRVTSRTQESRGQPPCSCRVLRPWGASSAWDRVSPQLRRSSRCTPPPRGCRAPQAPPKGFAAPVPSGAERAEPPAAPTCPHPLGVTAGGRWAVSAVPASALSCPTALTPPLRLQGRLPGRVLRSRDLRKCGLRGLVSPPGTLSKGFGGDQPRAAPRGALPCLQPLPSSWASQHSGDV